MMELLPKQGKALENQIFHIANEGVVSRYEFARAILRKRNFPDDLLIPIASSQLDRPARRPQNSSLSTIKLADRFGIKLRHWEAALDAFLQEIPRQTSVVS
jgi:dTDP-4-dehydrorhamnose reductase